MKFDFIIGNPPYQEETTSASTRMPPIYNLFMDQSYDVAEAVELITPARFLFNAGQTPKVWNQKMLDDPHLKVLYYEQDASKIFSNTEIKGGVAITYRDSRKQYGPIRAFVPYAELRTVLEKAGARSITESLTDIADSSNVYDLKNIYADHPDYKKYVGDGGRHSQLKTNVLNINPIFTDAPTEKPTEAPTEPDDTDAYRAYLEVLEDNKDLIKDYDWQFSNSQMQKSDKESRPVAFADITGDETPEMIVVCCDPDDSYRSGAYLRIYQYLDGSAQRVYTQTGDNELRWMDFTGSKGLGYPGGSQYVLYQLPGEKTLYHYDCGGMGLSSFEMVRSYGDSEDGIKMKTEAYYVDYQQNAGTDTYQVDSTEVGKSACLEKISELTGSSINVLMRNTIRTTENTASSLAYQYDNQAMTYEEAVSYLKEQIGESSNTQDNNPPKEDYSVIAGNYSTTFVRHYQSSLTIDSNGVFETEFYYDPNGTRGQGFTSDPAEYSLCRGKIVNLTKTGDYTYTFNVTDISYDYPVGESGDITYTDTYTHTDKSMHATFVKHPFDTEGTMTFYAKGITPTDMKESHFKSYVFPDNPKTSERAQTPTSYNIIYIPYGSADNPYYGK